MELPERLSWILRIGTAIIALALINYAVDGALRPILANMPNPSFFEVLEWAVIIPLLDIGLILSAPKVFDTLQEAITS